METNPLKIYVRVKSDEYNHTISTSKDLHEITFLDPKTKTPQKFEFYRIFTSETSQEEVFSTSARQLVDHVIDGFDSCVIAYGATGSGKSYSLVGGDSENTKGMLYRAMEVIFNEVKRLSTPKDIKVHFSMCEMYQEQVRDLGMACVNQNAHSIYPDQNLEVLEQLGKAFVKNLEIHQVSNLSEVYRIVNTGLDMRRNLEERTTLFSSKAHTIYIITIQQKDKTADWSTISISNLYLVDCAGNEKPTAKRGREWAENISISNSFAVMSKVLTSLRAPHIPYRDSKLTRLIQSSMRSEAMISFIATVNPNKAAYEKTLDSLKYLEKCKPTLVDYMVHALQPKSNKNSESDLKIRGLQDDRAELKETIRKIDIRNELQLTKIIELLGISTDVDTILQAGQTSKEILKIQKHKEALMKIESIAKCNRVLDQRIEENKEIFDRIKRIDYQNEERHVRRVLELKDEICKLQDEVEETKSRAVYNKNQQMMVRNDELRRMLAHSHMLLEEKSIIVDSIPSECFESLKTFNYHDMKSIGRDELVKEFNKRFQEQQANNEKQMQNVRDKFENFIAEKDTTFGKMVEEFKTRRERNKSYEIELRKELESLSKIYNQHAKVIENIKAGNYNQKLRPVLIPEHEIPEPPSELDFPFLFKSIHFVKNELRDNKRKTSSHPIKRLQAELKKIQYNSKTSSFKKSEDSFFKRSSTSGHKVDLALDRSLNLDLETLNPSELKKASEVLRGLHSSTCRDYEKCSDVRDLLLQQHNAFQVQLTNIKEERDRFKELYAQEIRQKYLSVSAIENQKKQLEKNLFRTFEANRSLSRPSTQAQARPMAQVRPRTSVNLPKTFQGKLLFD